jgi:hypothetical protein
MSNPDHICPECGIDLSKPIRFWGKPAMVWHLRIHAANRRHDEILRLRAGLESLRDGGFGCSPEAQEILDEGDYDEV